MNAANASPLTARITDIVTKHYLLTGRAVGYRELLEADPSLEQPLVKTVEFLVVGDVLDKSTFTQKPMFTPTKEYLRTLLLAAAQTVKA